MKTFTLMLVLLWQQSAEVQVLPGTAYARPAAGTILRSDAGKDFPGVFTLDGETAVRIGSLQGEYREVFVPQGFAVYMHADYLDFRASDSTARVIGDRVNMRLLPSTDGLLPIGTLSAGSGPLVVLEQTGDWMRVLAPAMVPLYAPDAAVQPVTEPAAADIWNRLYGTRLEHVLAASAKWHEQDPDAQAQERLLARAEELASLDIQSLAPEALDRRRAELDALSAQATWAQTISVLDGLRSEIGQLEELRARTARAAEAVADSQVQVDELALRRESRMLGLGLAFRGKGEPLTRKGSLHREGLEGAPIYTLHTTEGEILKLTAPPQVATLEALVGKKVTVDGRRLLLMVVDGPVLVVDKLVAYTPR
ncbi:MAG: SH3 domain-containing protein [Planctomycetota bacterium]|jgi:hypothetical protein